MLRRYAKRLLNRTGKTKQNKTKNITGKETRRKDKIPRIRKRKGINRKQTKTRFYLGVIRFSLPNSLLFPLSWTNQKQKMQKYSLAVRNII